MMHPASLNGDVTSAVRPLGYGKLESMSDAEPLSQTAPGDDAAFARDYCWGSDLGSPSELLRGFEWHPRDVPTSMLRAGTEVLI